MLVVHFFAALLIGAEDIRGFLAADTLDVKRSPLPVPDLHVLLPLKVAEQDVQAAVEAVPVCHSGLQQLVVFVGTEWAQS